MTDMPALHPRYEVERQCRIALHGILQRLARMEYADHARFIGHLYLTWATVSWEPTVTHREAAMEFDFWKIVRQHELTPGEALGMIEEAAGNAAKYMKRQERGGE